MEESEEHASAGPEDGHSRQRPSPGPYLTPYAPEPEEAPGYRSRPVTAALVAVALVVALGAGATVWAILEDPGPSVAPSAPSAPVSP
ncbi:hypothetical protein OHT57_26765 [Streptomyces sp. NBC_00285]|uniref:hypothetical protein n=1 Tax=Streptomyces sp. NBC_00285 TaxID=2975700 RepID=UPI002E280B4A|nr:hypothetical protein [Streptomyces sp. NBC_00285]